LAQLLHHLSPAYKYLTPLLVASRTSIATSLPLPSFRAPPPLTTAVEAHRSPPVHMVPPPPTTSAKVRKGKEPSRPPLRFLPSPDRRRTLVHRRAPPPPVSRLSGQSPPPLFFSGGSRWPFCQKPLPFSFVTPSPPFSIPYVSSSSFKRNPIQ
jgi:hypothetical protein